MSKLKIKLYNEGNAVIFKVLEQDGSLRRQSIDDTSNFEFKATNGIDITSYRRPEMFDDSIFIRGFQAVHDRQVSCMEMETEAEAEEYVQKVLKALKEFKENNYFEGIKHATVEDNTYEFSSNGKTMLKIKLYNEGSAVIFRVLEQCESLKYRGVSLEFQASNGLYIRSSSIPSITINRLWLRGHDVGKDNHTCICYFETETEAEEHVQNTLEALKEFADNNYFAGKDLTEQSATTVDHIYEF